MSLIYNFIRNSDGTKINVLRNGISRYFLNAQNIDIMQYGDSQIVIQRGGERLYQFEIDTIAVNGVPFVGDIEQAKNTLADVFMQNVLSGSAGSSGTDAHFTQVNFLGNKITLPNNPLNNSLHVIVGGITLTPIEDYTTANNVITLKEKREEVVNVNVFYKY